MARQSASTSNNSISNLAQICHSDDISVQQSSETAPVSVAGVVQPHSTSISDLSKRLKSSPALDPGTDCKIDINELQKNDSSISSYSRSSIQKKSLPNKDDRPCFSKMRQKHGTLMACVLIVFSLLRRNWGFIVFLIVQIIGFALLGGLAFEPLPWKAWYAFGVLGVTIAVLVSNLTPMVAMIVAVVALLAAQVISPSSAFKGLANEGILAVCIFFIVAEAIRQTAVLGPIFWFLFGKPKTTVEAHLRLVVPTVLVSSFFYNTPLVAILIPVIQGWSRRTGFPISRLLMPMNHAAALGGTLTLLGTSTNLVLDTLVKDSGILKIDENGRDVVGLPVFGITPVGAVVAGVGMVYLTLFSRFLRNDRAQTCTGAVIQNARKYTVSLKITKLCAFVGLPLQDTGFQHLQGLFMIKITRVDGTEIKSPEPSTVVEVGDVILFTGVVETITELYHIRGVVPSNNRSATLKVNRNCRRLVEVVISKQSSLVGKTVSESTFQTRVGAAVIGLCGQSEFLDGEISDVKICANDRLLLETGKDFVLRFGESANFDYVEEVFGSQPPREDVFHKLIAIGIVVGMIVVATVGVLPLVTCAGVAAFLLVATGCVTIEQAGKSVNWQVIIAIAAGFGISEALKETGAAGALGKFILRVFAPIGEIGLLFGIYFGTALVTSLITSNAAVALMFPIIKEILDEQGSAISVNNKLRALYALMLGGSSMFSTPIAFQTNMMVHGPGGYTFMDWVKFGVPMQIIVGTAGVLALRGLRFTV